ncbi:DUF7691 family protein [Nocardia inohanensis]|uniref:DUF7691 family protein n=1 Tax=Nocardia inohanensis TaxID=209246 RepID=UPI000B1AFBA9|nr:hypothetical protein [Nocardia inohanensis]
MSHILHVYLVDLAELESVIGSKDEKFLNRLLAEVSQHDPEDGCCERCDVPDCQDPECEECELCEDARYPQALRAVFEGGPFDENNAEAYVDALESICDELGPSIGDVNFWFGYEGLPDEILDLAGGMNGEGPLPCTEWNGWGHIDKESCARGLAEWEAIAAGPDDRGGYAGPIAEWFRAAKEADKDLIGFWAG